MHAIETSYAGCRFRSRLEARWAVFFDTLGIRWDYEPQGFHLPKRLSNQPGDHQYLPDFFLPALGAYFEVKGQLDSDHDLLRLLDCAAALSAPLGGCGDGPHLIVAGEIPRPGSHRHPVALHMHKGDLVATLMADSSDRCGGRSGAVVARDFGGGLHDVCTYPPEVIRSLLLDGGVGRPIAAYDPGYRAARSARFEHGEHG